MKNRIISLVLIVVMLFSCLSLEIFAATDAGTKATTGGSGASTAESGESLESADSTEQFIADYFAKYGTIGKSGGFNLDAETFAKKVAASEIIINTDFPSAASYSNTKDSWKYGGKAGPAHRRDDQV